MAIEFRVLLRQGVSGECPEEMVELSGLDELPVVELTGADCNLFRRIYSSEY